MKLTYHPMTEHPEVGKKVAVALMVCKGYFTDKTFAVWDGVDWTFDKRPTHNGGIPILQDQLVWRDVLFGKMEIRTYDIDTILEPCAHYWGYGRNTDEGWLYHNQRDMREDAGKYGDLDSIFRYCPICGKKLVLSEGEEEVELIEEVL